MQVSNEKNLTVGFFTAFAVILLVFGWGWLKSFSLFSQPQRFTARFDDVAGLNSSAPVSVQGVRVGTVEKMAFTPDKKIDCQIKITNETLRVPRGADISIQTVGLVGAKYLEITLPKDKDGKIVQGDPLQPTDVVAPPGEGDPKLGIVHNPVRVEVIVNNVAKRVDEIVTNIDSAAAGKAINNFSEASHKLNQNMDKLKDAADSVQVASTNISDTSIKFGRTADDATLASQRANQFFKDGDVTMKEVGDLAAEFRGTNKKVNKLLDNPNFSGDVKQTVIEARKTAETVREAMADFNSTLKDPDVRKEVNDALDRLARATDNVKVSMETVDKLSNDKTLRDDLKDIVRDAKAAVTGANNLLGDTGFKTDVTLTLAKVRNAADNLDVAAKQVQQVLGKRAPLLQLLFGRPGKPVPAKSAPVIICPPTVKPAVIVPNK